MVTASRDIKAGEELYMSYNFCIDCGGRASTYGTAEIFRDYGFVESYPQRWFFGKHGKRKISFELDESDDGLKVKWLADKPWRKAKNFMVKSLHRLLNLNFIQFDFLVDSSAIPASELSTIRSYHNTMINALQYALDDLDVPYNRDPDCEEGEHACAVSLRYDDLSWEPDETDYTVDNCDSEVIMSLDAYEHIDDVESIYQKIPLTTMSAFKFITFFKYAAPIVLITMKWSCTSLLASYQKSGVFFGWVVEIPCFCMKSLNIQI